VRVSTSAVPEQTIVEIAPLKKEQINFAGALDLRFCDHTVPRSASL